MPQIVVNGVRLRYDDTGRGDPVVFSHGLLWSRHMYGHQIDSLSGSYRCVAWDHRGQGDSEVPRGRVCSIEDCTEDALALFDALDLPPVHFVGLSMGGFVGLRLAARRPDRIRSLTLIDSAADPEPRANLPKYRAMNVVARLFGVTPLLARRVVPIMFGRSFLTDPSRQEEREAWRLRLMGNDHAIYKAVNGVIERRGVLDELARIRCPVLVLHGDEDKAIRPQRAEATARAIPGARLQWIKGAGHSSTVEQPEQVTEALRAFLSDVGAATSIGA